MEPKKKEPKCVFSKCSATKDLSKCTGETCKREICEKCQRNKTPFKKGRYTCDKCLLNVICHDCKKPLVNYAETNECEECGKPVHATCIVESTEMNVCTTCTASMIVSIELEDEGEGGTPPNPEDEPMVTDDDIMETVDNIAPLPEPIALNSVLPVGPIGAPPVEVIPEKPVPVTTPVITPLPEPKVTLSSKKDETVQAAPPVPEIPMDLLNGLKNLTDTLLGGLPNTKNEKPRLEPKEDQPVARKKTKRTETGITIFLFPLMSNYTRTGNSYTADDIGTYCKVASSA